MISFFENERKRILTREEETVRLSHSSEKKVENFDCSFGTLRIITRTITPGNLTITIKACKGGRHFKIISQNFPSKFRIETNEIASSLVASHPLLTVNA